MAMTTQKRLPWCHLHYWRKSAHLESNTDLITSSSFVPECTLVSGSFQRFSRAGPRGRGREWATVGVHPLSWLLSNNRLEEVCSTLTKGTFSSRLLLSNQDKGCTHSVAHSLPLPLGPALLNLSNTFKKMRHGIACFKHELKTSINAPHAGCSLEFGKVKIWNYSSQF